MGMNIGMEHFALLYKTSGRHRKQAIYESRVVILAERRL